LCTKSILLSRDDNEIMKNFIAKFSNAQLKGPLFAQSRNYSTNKNNNRQCDDIIVLTETITTISIADAHSHFCLFVAIIIQKE
jgi:hypothetical protein